MTKTSIDWGYVAQAFADNVARELTAIPFGIRDVTERGETNAIGRVAVGFYDTHPFADGRRETMHDRISALLEERGLHVLARASSGDVAVLIFDGIAAAAAWAELRDPLTVVLNDYVPVSEVAN